MPTRPATTVADVLSALVTTPGRPRLTWYGPDGERVELSGAVLDNWVSKTTNLLVEEHDAGPGTRVLLDLPPHWRAVLWAWATWRVGATVVLPGPETAAAGPVDVIVTDRPETLDADAVRRSAVVAVALPALARRFDGTLPAGAVDAAQAVMTYGDVVGWAPPVEPGRAALTAPGRTDVPDLEHADLLAAARAAVAAAPPGSRTLVPVGHERATARDLMLGVLGVLADQGSVVLVADDPAAGADVLVARTARVVGDERVTARLA